MARAQSSLAAAGTDTNEKAAESADPQFWVVQERIGKGQHSAGLFVIAQSSVTKEVSRTENKSAFWEVKVGAEEARAEENVGLLERPGM